MLVRATTVRYRAVLASSWQKIDGFSERLDLLERPASSSSTWVCCIHAKRIAAGFIFSCGFIFSAGFIFPCGFIFWICYRTSNDSIYGASSRSYPIVGK